MKILDIGWKEVIIPDPQGRRGLWVRMNGAPDTEIELCAGREGDDAHVRLYEGQVIDKRTIYLLRDVIDYLRYAAELLDDELSRRGINFKNEEE